ncbi:MAG: response regulator [Acidobacteriota bacterium]
MSPHVLIVEDEAAQLRGILRAMESLDGVRCTGCSTLAKARQTIADDPPDLLATDINLAGENGLELLTVLEAGGRPIPVIIMTAYRTTYDDRIPRSDSVTILEKPLSVADLRELIRQKLERSGSVAEGTPLQITDYLQLAAMGRSSARIEANLEDGRTALLNIIEGDIWSASLDELEDESVVMELMKAKAESIVMRALDGAIPERRIHVSCERLLLNLAAAEDEQDRDFGADDDTGEIEANPEPEADCNPLFAEAFAHGIEAGMAKDYEKAAEAFRKALEFNPDDPQTLYNLERVQAILDKE